jgi:hypothetical protein
MLNHRIQLLHDFAIGQANTTSHLGTTYPTLAERTLDRRAAYLDV